MNSLLASKQSRRRGIVFTILLAVTLLMMAFSGQMTSLSVQTVHSIGPTSARAWSGA